MLKTLHWDKISMTLIDVEINHAGMIFPGTREDIQNFMSSQGYPFIKSVNVDDFFYSKEKNRYLWFNELIFKFSNVHCIISECTEERLINFPSDCFTTCRVYNSESTEWKIRKSYLCSDLVKICFSILLERRSSICGLVVTWIFFHLSFVVAMYLISFFLRHF